eukprot:GFYU01017892.1.p1 GENE.GFYU01017892.1~~GFYU01017892.1.p1  ORF type:complete len:125 (+),score=8.57 GFYU01017892.1:38-412(+)
MLILRVLNLGCDAAHSSGDVIQAKQFVSRKLQVGIRYHNGATAPCVYAVDPLVARGLFHVTVDSFTPLFYNAMYISQVRFPAAEHDALTTTTRWDLYRVFVYVCTRVCDTQLSTSSLAPSSGGR